MLDSSAQQWETIVVSAGHVGVLMELTPADLIQMVNANIESIMK